MSYFRRGLGSKWQGAGVALGAFLLAYRSHAGQEVVPGAFNQPTNCDKDPDYVSGAPCPSPATPGDLYLTAHLAFSPTADQYVYLEEQATRASQLLCDATDGMMRIRSIQWSTSQAIKEDADIWWYPDQTPIHAHVNVLGLAPGHRVVNSISSARADTFVHELGHLIFTLHDSYLKLGGFGPGINGPARRSLDGTIYSVSTEGGPPGNAGYPFLLTIAEPSAERAHTIMQQSGPQACVDSTGQNLFQKDPIHSYHAEGYCWQTDASALGYADCSAWPGTTCQAISPLMSEFSGRNVFDPITNMAGAGFSPTVACPPPKETRQVVVQADIGLQDTCAAPPCADFHEQERLVPNITVLSRSGTFQIRDTSLDNATAWHDVPYTWVIQTDTTATLLIYHPDFPADLPVAVWDMSFGTHGRVETINGVPVDAFSENAGPTLAIGYGVTSSLMTEDGDGTVNRYEVQSKALESGAPSLQMVLDLTRLRLQFSPCVDGDKHLRCLPMLYGRYGTIQDDAATPEDETKITTRGGTIWDVAGEDIPHYDSMGSGANWEQICRFSYNPQTQRFESPMETHRQLAELLGVMNGLGHADSFETDPAKIQLAQLDVKMEWQHIVEYMLSAHSLDMSARDPETTDPITGLPGPDALTRCFEKPRNILWPSYAEYQAGLPDQIVLVLDRSGSMAQSPGGLAGYKTRLDFVKAGARALLDMHIGRVEPPEVGVIYFNQSPELQMTLAPLTSTNIELIKNAHFRDSTDLNPPQPVSPVPTGSTNIVSALQAAAQMHETSPTLASAKGIVLLSDGEDTVLGTEAVDEIVAELQKSYQLQTITTGFDANNLAIGYAVDTLNGFELATPDPMDLPGAFFEAGAREFGQSLAKHFRTAPDQETSVEGAILDDYLIEVEPGAEELQFLIFAGHGTNPSHVDYVPPLTTDAAGSGSSQVNPAAIGVVPPWEAYFTIHDPDAGDDTGEYPITVDDIHYKLVKIQNPQAGV